MLNIIVIELKFSRSNAYLYNLYI